jgi:hypothetical protein
MYVLLKNQRIGGQNRFCLGEVSTGGGGRERGRRMNKQSIHMHVNPKMIPVETVPRIGGGGMEESSRGVNSSIIYLIHCKNLCKCYNVPPIQHNNKK